jgi:hypothetical protein
MNENNNSIFSLNKFRKIKNNNYNVKEKCNKDDKKYIQTNPRFPLFDQMYFHAGDIKDWKRYGSLPLLYFYSLDYEKKNNIKTKIIKNSWDNLYKNIDYESIKNTFMYMFEKFKKGIFIIIRNNKLAVFLPFSNSNYKNNWYNKIYFSEEEKRKIDSKQQYNPKKYMTEFLQKKKKEIGYQKINFNKQQWVANNCFFRNNFPPKEGELNTNIYRSMLEALLKDRTIPDTEFFINPRDFPILKSDLTEPYNHLFDSEHVKVEEKYRFQKMCPIFSKSTTQDFADIMMPNEDDWKRVSNKFFTPSCKNSYRKNKLEDINTDWDTKKSVCIFRGTATGCGITLETNMRLKAADLSVDYPEILDAGVVDWNARMKKYMGHPVNIINKTQFRFKLASFITTRKKSDYKYILNIDGHVAACRLSSELGMMSTVLLVESKYKLWYSNLLKPMVHYVPINSDLSNLIEQINWCIKNDKKCKKIAENAKKLYDKYLTKDGVFNYLEHQINNIYQNKNFQNLLNIPKSIMNKKKNIAIISCYRDDPLGFRNKQRKFFIKIMSSILEPYCNFHIYIVEQSQDNNLFNIGKLKNIGFEIANKKDQYDGYVFSDIDTIPDDELLPYYLETRTPLCLAARGTRYEKKKENRTKPFTGACILFSKQIFEKINGYPNNFWGWGGEDDDLLSRLIINNKKHVYYPQRGSIIDIEEDENMKTINVKKKVTELIELDKVKYEKLYYNLTHWKENGLSHLDYKVLSNRKINKNTTQIQVNLLKESDEKKYPAWFPAPENQKFEQLKNIVYKKFREFTYEDI